MQYPPIPKQRRSFLVPRLPRVVAVVAAVLLPAYCSEAHADDVARADAELVAGYRAKLAELASWCEEQGLADEAALSRAWLAPHDPARVYVAMLVEDVGSLDPPSDASGAVLQWHQRFANLRREQAEAMYDLARRAVRAGRGSLGLELVLRAVREDPDHEAVRELLGFKQYEGRWHTLYEINNLRAGKVWHEKFGWLPEAHVPRYEQGQRYFRGRWISAEEDARLHRDILRGWDIETEHYTIRTNHSIEAGVRLAAKLEQFYRVWKQLFFRYFASDAQLAELFSGRARSRPVNLPRHGVVYFRNRDEYVQALSPIFPDLGVSVGIYVSSTQRAYFFADEDGKDAGERDDNERRTLLHEATHQLFHESRRVAGDVGSRDNFWIIEGIAMYMETLRQKDGYHVLGGFHDARIKAARHRLLTDHFYVPLAEFASYGAERMQRDPRIKTLYSQAAGLTQFLIHYDGGRYRDQLLAYLIAVYSGRATVGTLSKLTGTSYPELDAQYLEFMRSAPDE